MGRYALHWFRKGLRLHDNPSLLAAAASASSDVINLYCVFVLDPHFAKPALIGPLKYYFLLEVGWVGRRTRNCARVCVCVKREIEREQGGVCLKEERGGIIGPIFCTRWVR
jgi:hypothetical protein